MLDVTHLRNYTVERPAYSLIATAKEFDALPPSYQDQILFLNKEAGDFVWELSRSARLLTGGGWAPFEKGNFKTVEEFSDFRWVDESRQALKKWLYHRGLPFRQWVYILENGNSPVILTTWKMVLKFSGELLGHDDVLVFDQTLNWCLYYWHEDRLFFGKDNVYDNTEDLKEMEALNERKKNFPPFRHPYR